MGGWVAGWVVAHKTLLSSPVPIGIGIWAGLGLDNKFHAKFYRIGDMRGGHHIPALSVVQEDDQSGSQLGGERKI